MAEVKGLIEISMAVNGAMIVLNTICLTTLISNGAGIIIFLPVFGIIYSLFILVKNFKEFK